MVKNKRLLYKSLFAIIIIFLCFSVFEVSAKPKSLIKGYSDGGSIFKIPVFEPEKIDLDINSKYKREYAYPKVDVSKKPGTEYIKPLPKEEKPVPKSLKSDYSEGFVVRKKIEPSVGFIKEGEYTKPQPKPRVKVEVKKKSEVISVNSKVIPFKPSPKKVKRKPIIVIDPGHGGKDPGAIGRRGTKEKQITFLYSASLKKELERTGRYKVILTRYGDKYVPLKIRVEKARRYNGDIMISIHADSIADRDVRGFSVYTISNRRAKREANKLLRKSNREEVIRGVRMRGESQDVKEAIIDFAQKETKSVSDSFSKIVARHLGKKVKPLRRTNREGSLAVLTGADIPSVLVELGYLSNGYEEKLLRKKDHRKKIIKSLKSAIDEYFRRFDYFLE